MRHTYSQLEVIHYNLHTSLVYITPCIVEAISLNSHCQMFFSNDKKNMFVGRFHFYNKADVAIGFYLGRFCC